MLGSRHFFSELCLFTGSKLLMKLIHRTRQSTTDGNHTATTRLVSNCMMIVLDIELLSEEYIGQCNELIISACQYHQHTSRARVPVAWRGGSV